MSETAFTTRRTFFARTRFIDNRLPAADFFSVQRSHRALRRCLIGHFDKAKTFGLASFAIFDHADGVNLSESFEFSTQFLFTERVRQIAYEDIHRANTPFLLFFLTWFLKKRKQH